MRKMLLLLLIVLFIPTYLPNQVLGDQEEIKVDLLGRCQECRLFFTNEEDLRGKLISLDKESLVIEFHEKLPKKPFQLQTNRQTVPFEEILLLQCGDPIYDGAIWGFVIGGLSTAAFMGIASSIGREPYYEYDTSVDEMMALGFLIGGGIGSAVGFIIDFASGYRIETKEMQEWLEKKER